MSRKYFSRNALVSLAAAFTLTAANAALAGDGSMTSSTADSYEHSDSQDSTTSRLKTARGPEVQEPGAAPASAGNDKADQGGTTAARRPRFTPTDPFRDHGT